MLVRYVKACCPQQAIDEYTPDAWFDLLGDLSAEDCLRAVRAITQRQPFVAPSEIRDEVRSIRNERLDSGLLPAPTSGEPAEYIRQLKANAKRVGDGTIEPLAIEAGTGREAWDVPAVRRIREVFETERATARRRKAAERAAERKATRAFIDAQETLLGLDDLGEAAMVRAHEELFGEEQAAANFPLAADALGVTDQQKTVIRATQIAGGASS